MPVPTRFGVFAGSSQVDPFFKNVGLLLHGQGSNGGQNNTFLDSSANVITLTRNGGSPAQGSLSPYAPNWSNWFDGGAAHLTTPNNVAHSFGSGNFTVEAFVLATASVGGATPPVIAARWNAGGVAGTNQWLCFVNSLTPSISVSTGGTNADVSATGPAIPLGVPTHVAFVRSGNTLTVYTNGVAGTPVSLIGTLFATDGRPLYIAAYPNNGSTAGFFPGFISNLRIVKGTAVYTSNFTPPTSALTAITNTTLLTCQSGRFVDNSATAAAISVGGGLPRVTSFSPFAGAAYTPLGQGGSGYFDGSSWVTTAANAGLAFGSGDFTVEGWIYRGLAGTTMGIAGTGNGAGGWQLQVQSDNTVRWFKGGNTLSITSSGGVFAFSYNHIAVVRSGTTVTMYVNGANQGTATDATNYTDNTAAVGAVDTGGTNPLTGQLSDVRLVKGTAVYTGAFTPPTAPLSAIANTQLLCSFTNGAIYDSARQADLNAVNTAQTSTAQAKFGSSSLSFPAQGDRLSTPSIPPLIFGTSDLTIEGFLRPTYGAGTNSIIISNMANNSDLTAGRWAIYLGTPSGGAAQVGILTNNSLVLASGVGNTVASGAWTHFAIVRQSGTAKIFIGGVQAASGAWSTSLTGNTTVVGAIDITNVAFGNIQELRVTNGVARYTANFTPPTAPFLNQ